MFKPTVNGGWVYDDKVNNFSSVYRFPCNFYSIDSDMNIVDSEMDEASAANEKEEWFWCEMRNGGHTYHRYKPSVAKLLTERDGLERIMERSKTPKKRR